MRVIVRRERPHPGAQLRFDDVDGYRLTGFVTNTTRGQLADLEVRHRCRARCEDRIRNAKDSGLANLPLHGFDQNRIWCQIVALAGEITAWMGLLAHPDHQARRWEPKRLRYRLFTIPATLVRRSRRTLVHVSARLECSRNNGGLNFRPRVRGRVYILAHIRGVSNSLALNVSGRGCSTSRSTRTWPSSPISGPARAGYG